MTNTGTGWPKGWPNKRGFYWTRDTPDDTNILLVEIQANRLTICGDDRHRNVREAFEDSEFLGPISPSDAEQLMELRKACKAALPYVREVLAYTRSKPRIRCATRTIQQLQNAIGGRPSEKTVNSRDVSMERESGVRRMDTDGEPDTDNRHSTPNDVGSSEESSSIP